MQRKRDIQKLRTFQAFDYSEKTEIENLFLDCIDLQKKDYYKAESAKVSAPPVGKKSTSKALGIHYSMNGTIMEVALNNRGKHLKNRLITDKSSLVTLFEEIFGSNKAPLYEIEGPTDRLAITGGVSVGLRQGEQNTQYAKSMSNFNIKRLTQHGEMGTGTTQPPRVIKDFRIKSGTQAGAKTSITYASNASNHDLQ